MCMHSMHQKQIFDQMFDSPEEYFSTQGMSVPGVAVRERGRPALTELTADLTTLASRPCCPATHANKLEPIKQQGPVGRAG